MVKTNKSKYFFTFLLIIVIGCLIYFLNNSSNPVVNDNDKWAVDFFDDFDSFDDNNWQDQRIWVNDEKQCYLPNGEYGTREVSNGTLKLKVINIETAVECDNMDKHGNQHPKTKYVAGRIASKNRKEFVKGKWTARLRIHGESQKSMFPAWWILGAQNNEPPVQEEDETVCWLSLIHI